MPGDLCCCTVFYFVVSCSVSCWIWIVSTCVWTGLLSYYEACENSTHQVSICDYAVLMKVCGEKAPELFTVVELFSWLLLVCHKSKNIHVKGYLFSCIPTDYTSSAVQRYVLCFSILMNTFKFYKRMWIWMQLCFVNLSFLIQYILEFTLVFEMEFCIFKNISCVKNS